MINEKDLADKQLIKVPEKGCSYIYEETTCPKSEKGINVFKWRKGQKYANREDGILGKLWHIGSI